MNQQQILEYIKNPSLVNESAIDGLREISKKYPYFQPAHMLLLKALYQLPERNSLHEQMAVSAIRIADRRKLFLLLHPECNEDDSMQYNNDTLLLRLTNEEPSVVIDEPKNKKQAAATHLYNRYFELDKPHLEEGRENKVANKTNTTDLIDKFIEADPRIRPVDQGTPSEPIDIAASSVEEKEVISETLAEIYVKQQLYKKAIAMYHKLSLKFPEKSAYFASRIEELKKN